MAIATPTLVEGAVALSTATRTFSRVVPALVKKRFVPLYSRAPASAVVRFVPDVNLRGLVLAVAVPAGSCSLAVAIVVPLPIFKLPDEDRFMWYVKPPASYCLANARVEVTGVQEVNTGSIVHSSVLVAVPFHH